MYQFCVVNVSKWLASLDQDDLLIIAVWNYVYPCIYDIRSREYKVALA